MSRATGLFFMFLFVIGLSVCSLAQDNRQAPIENGKTKGFDVVFVVDVSPAVGEKNYLKLIESFVSSAFDTFHNSVEINDKNNYYLITFAETAKMFEADNIEKDSILNEIKNQIKKKNRRINIKNGLDKVFDLIGDGFPQKVGIVLFISNGNDGNINLDSTKGEFAKTIHALRRNGFTVYSIYLAAGSVKCQECMTMVSEWSKTSFFMIEKVADIRKNVNNIFNEALNLKFSSPIERKTYKVEEKKWKDEYNQLKKRAVKLEKENKDLRDKFKYEGGITRSEEDFDRGWTETIEKQKTKIRLLWILILILLIILALFLKDKVPFFHSKHNLLWGKLNFKNGSEGHNNYIEIDLSTRLKGALIKTLGDSPNFRILSCSHYGRKVMCVQVKKGCVDYYKYENEKAYRTDQYIGTEPKFFKISNLYGNHYSEYEYHFLDILKNSCMEPAPIKLFFGREKILDEIRINFLEKKNNCFHLIISGIGCSGKTSLLRYLKLYIEDDDQLEEKCAAELIEYNSAEDSDLIRFYQDFEEKVKKLLQNKRKRRILLVDNYDDLLLSGEKKPLSLFHDCHTKHEIYLVLAGKIPASLINEKYYDFLPHWYKETVLKGIENPPEVIDSMLKEIGFPGYRLRKEIKNQISYYSSGMPYFCKRILIELLGIWLERSNKKSFTRQDVKTAANKVSKQEKEYYMKEIVPHYDEIDENRRDKVRFKDIMNCIAEFKGLVEKEEIKTKLTFDVNEDIFKRKKKNFEEKLENLKVLGLVVEEKGCLVGVPQLFYLQKEEESKSETFN